MTTIAVILIVFIWLCTCRISYLWGRSDATFNSIERRLRQMQQTFREQP